MQIEKICSLEKLVEVHDEWNTLVDSSSQNCVFLTNEWFCTWIESFGELFQLSVLLFRDTEGHLYGAAPLLETGEGLKFIANREVTDYCDFIVKQGQEELFYKNFLEFWQKEFKPDSRLHLMNIREESPTLSLLPHMAEKSHFKNTIFETEVAPRLDLPLTYEDYLKNLVRKNRHELRRKTRKIESQKGLLYKRVNDPDEIRNYIDLFIELHKKSSSAKREFWKKRGMEMFFRTLTAHFSTNGWIELIMLYLEEDLAAIGINFIYFDEIHFYNIAFDPKYASVSPGIYLFDRSIRQAIQDNKRRADFLRGKEKFKYDLGAKECKIMDLFLSEKEMNS